MFVLIISVKDSYADWNVSGNYLKKIYFVVEKRLNLMLSVVYLNEKSNYFKNIFFYLSLLLIIYYKKLCYDQK